MAITGPSGAGKTYTALKIAKGLSSGKIAVIDTEAGSAQLYSNQVGIPDYDIVELAPPFTTPRYIELIDMAVREKYDVLIIDSISHQWQGAGSIMDRKEQEQLAKPTQNSFTLFSKYTPEHERFKQSIIQSDIHIIATMRSKTEYAMETNERGKTAPRKVGLAPIQREGMDYEFSTVLDLNLDHIVTVSKDRTSLFDGKNFVPDENTGIQIKEWLKHDFTLGEMPINSHTRILELQAINHTLKSKGFNESVIKDYVATQFGKKGMQLSTDEMAQLKKWVEDYQEFKPQPAITPSPINGGKPYDANFDQGVK